MRKLILNLLLILSLGLLATGCVYSYPELFIDKTTDPEGKYQFTEEEASTALYVSYRYRLMKLIDGEWKLDKTKITIDQVNKTLDDVLVSMDWLLSCNPNREKNCSDWRRYLNAIPGMVEALKRQEIIFKEIHRRFKIVGLHNRFSELRDVKEQELDDVPGGSYSLKILWPDFEVFDKVKFTAEYLEKAKENGTLKLVDTYRVIDRQKYSELVPDTERPEKEIWEPYERGFLIKSYKIIDDKPSRSNVDYIELYRINFNGDKQEIESKPALRGYRTRTGNKVEVLVLDTDFEGERGYGLPDRVVNAMGVVTGRELYTRGSLRRYIDEVFPEEKQRIRKRMEQYVLPEIYSIYKQGEERIEEKIEGKWTVPYNYIGPQKDNYSYGKVLVKSDSESDLKQIKYFVKKWTSDDKIVKEYYRPKPDYAKRDIVRVDTWSKTIEVLRKGHPVVEAQLDVFARNTPWLLDYTDPSDERVTWRLTGFLGTDEDGNWLFKYKQKIVGINETEPVEDYGGPYGL